MYILCIKIFINILKQAKISYKFPMCISFLYKFLYTAFKHDFPMDNYEQKWLQIFSYLMI